MYDKKIKKHLMTQIRQEIGAQFRDIRQSLGLSPCQVIAGAEIEYPTYLEQVEKGAFHDLFDNMDLAYFYGKKFLVTFEDITPRVPQRPILHLSLKGRC